MRISLTTILFWYLSFATFNAVSSAKSENKYYPNKYACPVTADLFPKQIGCSGIIRFIFPGNTIANRISISLTGAMGESAEVRFRWIGVWGEYTRPPLNDFGIHFGSFVVNPDGNPNCFFLGPAASIPGNIEVDEFDLQIPEGLHVISIVFSSSPSELISKTCPMPGIELDIVKAYEDFLSNPRDEGNVLYLIQLLEKTIPTYDCRRSYDYEPVPAWWLADDRNVDKWIEFLYEQVSANNGSALKIYFKYFATSDGYFLEGLSYGVCDILQYHPVLVLDNWTSIRSCKEKISEATSFHQGPENIQKMINIYRQLANSNRELKTACEEIIRVLRKDL